MIQHFIAATPSECDWCIYIYKLVRLEIESLLRHFVFPLHETLSVIYIIHYEFTTIAPAPTPKLFQKTKLMHLNIDICGMKKMENE